MRQSIPILLLALCVSGCAIMDRSDKFGADLDIGVGGIIGYIADLHLRASVGFSKTCPDHPKKQKVDPATGKLIEKEETDAEDEGAGDPDPLGIDHFL